MNEKRHHSASVTSLSHVLVYHVNDLMISESLYKMITGR